MNRMIWHGRTVQRRLESAAAAVPKCIAEVIAEKARQIVPVKTGHLKSTIEATDDGVHVTADYAAQVELGTSKRAAQPFVRPAIERFNKADLSKCVK